MDTAHQKILAHLDQWKPFAEMGNGHPAKRGIRRFLEAGDEAARRDVLARANAQYYFFGMYARLGIRREGQQEKEARFEELIAMSLDRMAEVLEESPKDLLVLLQEGFEFGRFEQEAQTAAIRQFLLVLWDQRANATPFKYSIYANGVMFAAEGISHDEMAIKFTKLGLGNSRPIGGGQMRRRDKLVFEFDTSSTAFGNQLKSPFVVSSLRRWVRSTGGQDDQMELNHLQKLGVV